MNEHIKQLYTYYNPTYLVSVLPEDLSKDDNFLLWLMKEGYETSYQNKNNKILQNQYTHRNTQIQSEIDDCFCFDDEQTQSKAEAQKQIADELETKFQQWKIKHPNVKSQGLGVEAEQWYLFKKEIAEEHMWDID